MKKPEDMAYSVKGAAKKTCSFMFRHPYLTMLGIQGSALFASAGLSAGDNLVDIVKVVVNDLAEHPQKITYSFYTLLNDIHGVPNFGSRLTDYDGDMTNNTISFKRSEAYCNTVHLDVNLHDENGECYLLRMPIDFDSTTKQIVIDREITGYKADDVVSSDKGSMSLTESVLDTAKGVCCIYLPIFGTLVGMTSLLGSLTRRKKVRKVKRKVNK